MDDAADKIARDWIAYARLENPEQAPAHITARASSMFDLPLQQPELTWAAIRRIIAQYDEGALHEEASTEAQRVVGLIAAGPMHDLVTRHGAAYLDQAEAEARHDGRMRWALDTVRKLRDR